jgi:hypothetical protein
MRARLPSIESIGQDAPLRLGVAAALAFPDGTMTASGLRREAARRRLVAGQQEGSRQRDRGCLYFGGERIPAPRQVS